MNIDEKIKIILKGVDEVVNEEELRKKLIKAEKDNIQLTVKLGLDPTAPDIHLGHAVVLRKIKQLQDLGHKAVIIIGDFTGMIGDPTGRAKARKQLTREQVLSNAETYKTQIFKVLDKNKTEVRFNSEWLSKLNLQDVINLSSKYTVARMLEREDFKNRFSNNQSIGIHEFFYPLMQAFDSVSIKADIELGGTDQRFNILMGRTIQKDYEMEQQVALFMPILEGLDGKEKMSKSLGNYIGVNEPARDMYMKVMKVPDSLIIKYFELATDIHPDKVDEIKDKLEKGVNPRDIKMSLAFEITRLYWGEAEAFEAERYFKDLFQKGEVPKDIDEIAIDPDCDILELLVKSQTAKSKGESRRLINQGGVRVNGEKIQSFEGVKLASGDVIQVGKQKVFKIVKKS